MMRSAWRRNRIAPLQAITKKEATSWRLYMVIVTVLPDLHRPGLMPSAMVGRWGSAKRVQNWDKGTG